METSQESTSTKMPYIPALKGSDSITDFVLLAIAFILTALLIYAYMRFLKVRRTVNHNLLTELEQRRPQADEKSRFISSKPVDNNLTGTMVFTTGQNLNVIFLKSGKNLESTVINVSAESFVITLPRIEEDDFTPQAGEVAAFTAVKGGRNYAFRTNALQVYTGGLRACAFAHTDDIEVTDRRKKTRVSGEAAALFTVIPANLINNKDIPLPDLFEKIEGYIPANVQDISTGGCALRTRSPLKFTPGDIMGMYSTIPETEEEFFVLGGIISSTRQSHEQGGGSLVCVEFLATPESIHKQIMNHVSQTIEDEIID